MDKLKMQTNNIAEENFKKLSEMFPNAVTETIDADGKVVRAIDKDVLMQEISCEVVEGREERYQFTWPDKKKAILLANSPINSALRPCKEESVDFDNTKNLYIEGDNLDVLKLLRETYLGKVKMIYIDPPYNTGNDFVYNDDFAESTDEYLENSGQYDEDGNRLFPNTESNGRFHTDWLNMIYPRLKVAKDLLSDDGAIFISVDDNELENIIKICNEIFGENNFIGQWNWYKSATPPNLSYKIKKNIEYVICYEKHKNDIRYKGIMKTSPSNDPFTKPQNSIKRLTFPKGSIKANCPDGIYVAGIYGTEKFPNKLLNDLIVENGLNANEVTFENKFIWIQSTLEQNIKDETTIELSKQLVLSYKRKSYLEEVPPNFIDMQVNVDTTENAGRQLKDIFDGIKIFDYPKPVSLIKYIINFLCNKEDTILDFFSGSATTAHAVMELNAEDGGNRKFIMVQLPEKCDEKSEAYKAGYYNICEIGKERIRRAGSKIIAKMLEDNEPEEKINAMDTGFRVLKLDSSNMKDVYYSPDEYNRTLFDDLEDNIKEDRTPEDLLFQVMLELGIPLSSKIDEQTIDGKKVFNVADNHMLACFDTGLTDEVITTIAKQKPLYFVMRDSSLDSDSVAINFDQIFESYSKDTVRRVL